MKDDISDKDKKIWNDFISSSEKLPDKDNQKKIKKSFKSNSVDLHGYSLIEANKIVDEEIKKAYSNGINKLTIVTGKGLHSKTEKDPYVSKDLGILKYSIPEYIKNDNELMSMINSIQEASIEDGGSGAFYINLKKKL